MLAARQLQQRRSEGSLVERGKPSWVGGAEFGGVFVMCALLSPWSSA